MLEKKEMSKNGWKRVIESDYQYEYLEDCKGIVSILHLKKLTSPCYKEYTDYKLKIADNGYYWLQFAIDGEKWWLTVMFDENGKLIQYYFDITNGNVIKRDGTSHFYDLFLDIVSIDGGKTLLLDEDELNDALREGTITQQEFESAHIIAKNIIKGIKFDKSRLDEFCYSKLNQFINRTREDIYDE